MHSLRRLIKEIIENQNDNLTPVEHVNKYVYHKSNPIFREKIEKEGLKVFSKSDTWLSDTPIFGKVIFATDSDNKKDWFNSNYDDDIYKIDTTKINNKWFKDPNFEPQEKKVNINTGVSNSKHIITFENIQASAIELIYSGTGNSSE